MYYIVTILVSMILIIIGNSVFSIPLEFTDVLWLALETTIYTVGVIAIDGIFAFLIRRLTPMKWYKPGLRIFKVSKKEKDFYNTIKIKAWKCNRTLPSQPSHTPRYFHPSRFTLLER